VSVPAEILAGAVRVYQLTLRGVIGSHCRFEPSCSHYAIEALHTHGALRGTALATRRILRCNPWHPGGFDPVPDYSPSLSSKGRTAP
jgi:putative membrane protein insertion efficiency factor